MSMCGRKLKKFIKWCWATLPRRVVSSILIILFIITPISFLFNRKTAEAAWWNDSWAYRKAIEVGSAGSDQTDFQVKVLTNSDLSTDITNGKIQADLDDLRFTDVNGNMLPYWIEDNTAASVDVWVKIPTLETSGATVYMYYGNPQAVSISSAENVFIREISGVQGAWNMDESSWNGTSGEVIDSSGNGNNGTASGATTTAGKFGNGGSFDGDNDYVEINDASGLSLGEGDYTVNMWFKRDTAKMQTLISKYASANYEYAVHLTGADQIEFQTWSLVGSDAGTIFWNGTAAISNPTGWHNVSVIKTGNILSVALDGIVNGSTNTTSTIGNGSAPIDIGQQGTGSGSNQFDGLIDNVRIYNRALSSEELFDIYGSGGDHLGYVSTSYIGKELIRKYASSTPTATAGTEEKGNGPVAYWAFDEGYGTTAHDETANRNDGDIEGATWKNESECVSGKCLYFDGTDDYANMGSKSSIDNLLSFTWSAWIRPTSWGGSGYGRIIGKNLDGGYEKALYLYNASSAKSMEANFDTDGSVDKNTTAENDSINLDEWQYITATFDDNDDNTFHLYVNGKEVSYIQHASHTGSWFNDSDYDLLIGDRKNQDRSFNGFIDEVKIYPYARSEDQIKMDYNVGLQGTNEGTATALGGASEKWMSNGLVGHWKMDEASGTTVADASGYGNTGTLTNAQETGTGEAAGTTANMVDADNATLSSTDDAYNNMILYITGGAGCGITTGAQRLISDYIGSSKTITVGTAFSAETDNCTFEIRHQSGGKFGNGMEFDGVNDYINSGSGSSINNLSNLTYSAWIYPRSVSGSSKYIINKRYKGVYIDNAVSPVAVHFAVSLSNDNMDVYCTSPVQLNTWTNITITWDGTIGSSTNSKIYLNGSQCIINSFHWGVGTTYSESSMNLAIGSWNDGTSSYFDGKIDDVRIYNRALSPSEVQKLYNYAPGPVGHWKMDEKVSGDGEKIYDVSGNGNDGTTHYGANTTGMDCTKPGKFGSACQFDGTDDSIQTANLSFVPFRNSNFSVSAWVKPTSTSGTQSIWSYGEFDDVGNTIGLGISNGQLAFLANGTLGAELSGLTVNANQWSYVGYVRTLSSIQFFVNNSASTASYTSGTSIDGDPFLIGATARNSAIEGYFNGTIDDVRVYNYARTQEQILQDMAASAEASAGQGKGLNPIAHYKFDEGYGDTAHNSGYGGSTLDGTLQNGGSGDNDTNAEMWDKGGKYNGAMEFDGTNDYVSVPDADNQNDFNYNQEFSVSTWFKAPSSQITSGTVNDIIAKWDGTGGYPYSIRFFNQTDSSIPNKIRAYRFDGSHGPYITSSSTFNDNSWHHLVFSRKNSYLYLYIDGRQDGNPVLDTTNTTTTNSSLLYLGRRGGSNIWFTGLIDEVKIYNYALTSDQVKEDYNQGVAMALGFAPSANNNGTTVTGAATEYCIPGDAAQCDKPVGEWNFNEKVSGDGQTLYDTSGNGNDGTSNDGANNTGMNCSVPGKFGSGCQFDGVDDYVQTNSEVNFSTGVTYSFWMKGSPGVYGQAIGNIGVRCLAGYHENTITCTADGDSSGSATSNIDVLDNQWHYIGFASSGNAQSLYVDGKLSGAATETLGAGESSLRIGNSFGSSYYYAGNIDQVRVYDYARTPAQIAWEYNRGKPIAEYRFNECQGDTIHDESGNANHGTINLGASGNTVAGTCTSPTDGTGAWYDGRSGKYGASLDFDGGDDYVSVANSTSLTNSGSFAVSAWVKPDATGTWTRILQRGNGDGNGYSLRLNGTRFVFQAKRYSNGENARSDQDFVNGNWYHVVGIYNGSNISMYVNGILQSSSISDGTTDDGSSNLDIGRKTGTNSSYFDGQIDDVKIFNYALTEEQVAQIYNNSSAVNFGN